MVSNYGQNSKSLVKVIPHNFTFHVKSPDQVLSQRALLAELIRAEDLADILMDSAAASAMYLTAFRRVGKDSSKSFLEVFLATTVEAIAGFRLDKDESQAFLNRESLPSCPWHPSTPMSSNSTSVCPDTWERRHQFMVLFQINASSSPKGNLLLRALEKKWPFSGSFHSLIVSVSAL